MRSIERQPKHPRTRETPRDLGSSEPARRWRPRDGKYVSQTPARKATPETPYLVVCEKGVVFAFGVRKSAGSAHNDIFKVKHI